MSLTNYERETIVNYNEAESTASVYTHSRKLQNKLNKLLNERTDIKVVKGNDDWTQYEVPKNWIKVSPPRQVNYTDEQKAAMAERLAAARESNKEKTNESTKD